MGCIIINRMSQQYKYIGDASIRFGVISSVQSYLHCTVYYTDCTLYSWYICYNYTKSMINFGAD